MVITINQVKLITSGVRPRIVSIHDAAQVLRRGGFVLMHDAEKRENEFDMVAAAELVTPVHVARMRSDAGGLICAALEGEFAASLGLRYMHEMLAESSVPGEMILGRAPYGDHPTFSIYVNHIRTYTGVTDADRALTISEVAALYGRDGAGRFFRESFRTPGHVPLLVASPGLLEARTGHTEMSVYLARMAGLRPAAAICEMVDSKTHLALDGAGAAEYAERNDIPIVQLDELLEHAGVS